MPGAPHSHALGAARARVPRRALRFEGRAPTGRSRSQSSCLSSPAASRRFILPFPVFFFFFLRAFPAAASAEAPPSPPSSSPPAAAPRDVLSRRSSSVAQTPHAPAQLSAMKSKLVRHSPDAAQPAHAAACSGLLPSPPEAHAGRSKAPLSSALRLSAAQTPHDVGHCFRSTSGSEVHCPCAAAAAQPGSRSRQRNAQPSGSMRAVPSGEKTSPPPSLRHARSHFCGRSLSWPSHAYSSSNTAGVGSRPALAQ
mmetsp:Transcript_51154/g.166449  ORF Transcript_51154/g.166449 Transcript_51154/m.166449 type:complete len:253 (+) Transcript_51154:233-991(+)